MAAVARPGLLDGSCSVQNKTKWNQIHIPAGVEHNVYNYDSANNNNKKCFRLEPI